MDCWINDCIPGKKPYDPTVEKAQLDYNKWLAEEAHRQNLMIGLKNDAFHTDELSGSFDFAINEQCFQYKECDLYKPFISKNKAVFGTEYSYGSTDSLCQDAKSQKISLLLSKSGNWWSCQVSDSPVSGRLCFVPVRAGRVKIKHVHCRSFSLGLSMRRQTTNVYYSDMGLATFASFQGLCVM